MPLAAAGHDAEHRGFEAPDLTAQSIMLVSPQSIEASLIARRLQRWGGQTCMVSDVSVAQALLPERSWHAVLLDHALGAVDIELLGAAARPHATQRIVMFTPATRHELQPSSASSAFTGYLVKPLRAASLAARLTTAPEIAAPELAVEALVKALDPTDAPATVPAARGLSILVAEDNEINALLMRSLLSRLGHHAVICTNGEEALESWLAAQSAGAPYDLVLMDIQMPQLDGIETTKQIRDREAGQARPPHADPCAHRQHAGGRSLRLLRGRDGRLSDQAARSRKTCRRARGPHRLPAPRRLKRFPQPPHLIGPPNRGLKSVRHARTIMLERERPAIKQNI